MGLRPIYGHEGLLARLGAALESGRFPQATLFAGAFGVGKQRLALWVAQGLLCDRGPAAPCGECRSCRQVSELNHPDLHWFVPILRPRSGDVEQQIEEVESLLGEVLARRRAEPLWGPPEPMASHPLASIRLLHRRVNLKPFQGPRKVVILGNAERLVVQESSQEAANALLKVLEEPPSGTYLVLTTPEPQALLPTLRSRLVTVRVGGVPDRAVRRFLQAELDRPLAQAELDRRVLLAGGSIGQALAAGEAGALEADKSADQLLSAIRQGPERWAEVCLAQAPWAARGEFTTALDSVALRLRSLIAQEAAAHPDRVGRWLRAMALVERTRREAQGNVNPQLALAVLAQELGAPA